MRSYFRRIIHLKISVYLACKARSTSQLNEMGNCGGLYMYLREKVIVKRYMKY